MTATAITVTLIVVISLVIVRKYRERAWGKCKSKKSLKDKTVIITGANSGIGKATTEELLNRDANVIMACRDMAKAESAAEDIRKRTRNGRLRILKLDLASFDSIRDFARTFSNTEDKLDILINNAGVFQCPYMQTQEGFEYQFGVNHLGHFLLTNLLLNKIKQSTPSRIIVVSSALYKRGSINLSELNSKDHYNKRKAYNNSKLANILFAHELSEHLKDTGVCVYSISPGMVWTNLGRYIKASWLKMALLAPVAWIFIRTPLQGCQTVLHCAISEEVEGESGHYYRNCTKEELNDVAKDMQTAKTLWQFSEQCIHDVHADLVLK